MSTATASIYLDTIHPKKNGLYPVRLRIYYAGERKYYTVSNSEDGQPLALSKEDFQKTYGQKPRSPYREYKADFDTLIADATKAIKGLNTFSFEGFERAMWGITNDVGNVSASYEAYLYRLRKNDKVGTASSYELSLKSLSAFWQSIGGKGALTFKDITPDFLQDYETYMRGKEYSDTTIGIYLRPLRSIFNYAIHNLKEIHPDLYPFRRNRQEKGKYEIPAGGKVNKALSEGDLKKIYFADVPTDSDQFRARAFWFFSYLCNGMNIADIAEMKYGNISGNTLQFSRVKTKSTAKRKKIIIEIDLSDYALEVIERFGNADKDPSNYVFPIYAKGMSAKEMLSKKQAFTKYINQHIKNLAKSVGVTSGISTNYGRHTFTTIAITNGASIELIRESLGHTDIKTTQGYLGSFTKEKKKQIADKLMKFAKD